MGAGTQRWWIEEEAFEMRARRETLRLLSDWNSRNYALHRYEYGAWDHSSLSRECEALFSAIDGVLKPPPVFGAGSFEHWKSVTIVGVKFTAPEPPPMTAVEAARLDSEVAMGLSQAFRDAKPTVAGRMEMAQRMLAEGRIDSETYVKILEAPVNEILGLKWVGTRWLDNNFDEGREMASLRDVTMTLEEFRARFKREPEAPGPDGHCCICNRKMPRVLGHDHRRFTRDNEPALLVNDAGWMKVFFPWKWPDVAVTLPEHSNICPLCAERVAGYIAHLKKPAFDDNDL